MFASGGGASLHVVLSTTNRHGSYTQEPYEFPAYETLGCEADCAKETDITPLVVTLSVDFSKAPKSMDASALMAAASWNVCLDNPERRDAGLNDYCLYSPNRVFETLDQVVSQALQLKRARWYVKVEGDYLGVITGKVLDASNSTIGLSLMALEPSWETCDAYGVKYPPPPPPRAPRPPPRAPASPPNPPRPPRPPRSRNPAPAAPTPAATAVEEQVSAPAASAPTPVFSPAAAAAAAEEEAAARRALMRLQAAQAKEAKARAAEKAAEELKLKSRTAQGAAQVQAGREQQRRALRSTGRKPRDAFQVRKPRPL
jgi:hypothetical protein